MRSVIIQHKVNIKSLGNILVYFFEKLFEFSTAVSLIALTNKISRFCIQGCKEGCCSMALVIMGPSFCLPRAKRQQWLGAVKSLYLALFVHTKHHGVFGGGLCIGQRYLSFSQ